MSEYRPPRPLSIAVTNLKQYLLGHRRGWDDAQKRIAELEEEKEELRMLIVNALMIGDLTLDAQRMIDVLHS